MSSDIRMMHRSSSVNTGAMRVQITHVETLDEKKAGWTERIRIVVKTDNNMRYEEHTRQKTTKFPGRKREALIIDASTNIHRHTKYKK
jgi:hypothetical protein